MTRHLRRALVFAVSLFVLYPWCVRVTRATPTAVRELPSTSLPPDRLVVPVRVAQGSSFGEAMMPWALPVYEVRQAALSIYDLALVNTRNELSLVLRDGDHAPIGLRYGVAEGKTLYVDKQNDKWIAHFEEAVWTPTQEEITLDIHASLWEAGLKADLRPGDLPQIARLFEYDVDFNTEIRAGAKLGMIADVERSEGFSPRLGAIYAVRLLNDGEVYEAIRFVGTDDKAQYYHPDGTSVVRAFLRSPLAFSRITSGFNPNRFHPILKRPRPHLGTDFGAPTGTPVRSVANGVVTYAGRAGGHGNYIKVKHRQGYETSYSHLSVILVRRGEKVSIGETIGRVGTTGMSTGPHLHYQMWKNGRIVNAMRQDLPIGDPIPQAYREAFAQEVKRWLPLVPVQAPAPPRPSTP